MGKGCQIAIIFWRISGVIIEGLGSIIRIEGKMYPSVIDRGRTARSLVEIWRVLPECFDWNGLAVGDVRRWMMR
jgi:hypothetical protein